MYRSEYPRPNFVREDWLPLNGQWNFAFDDDKVGLDLRWEKNGIPGDMRIEVPFAFQAKLSGIGDPDFHDEFWYSRKFSIPAEWAGRRIRLNFGAVDYECKVFINGDMAGGHIGGSVGFGLDITSLLTEGENELTLWVRDPSEDETIPRGKQDWLKESHAIWYTRTSGIWQSVWLEPVHEVAMQRVHFTPDVDRGTVKLDALFTGCAKGKKLRVQMSLKGRELIDDLITLREGSLIRTFELCGPHIFHTNFHSEGMCWSPEHPNLIDVTLTLSDDKAVLDKAETYFGLRKVHIEAGMVHLNNRACYHKMVLDQGYWPGGLLTAPSDDDFKKDIELCKAMGFNGARKHQKTEDPRFFYWADKLGFLVWGEIASAPVFTMEAVQNLTGEFMEEVARDYNHPSIVSWVPFNESWGVPEIAFDKMQQAFSVGLVNIIKAMDGTRLVVSNDGWEQTVGDICAIHNYGHGGPEEHYKYEIFKAEIADEAALLRSRHAGRPVYAQGFKHLDQPIMLTEVGGIAYKPDGQAGWGYTSANSEEGFLADYARVIEAIYASTAVAGFCYTQVTDVEQEVNGLLSYDRKPKCDLDKIRQINDMWRPQTIV